MNNSDKQCGRCAFYKSFPNSERGTCKRHPPAFVLRQDVEYNAYGELEKKLDTYQEQPEVACGDFCGEWRNTA